MKMLFDGIFGSGSGSRDLRGRSAVVFLEGAAAMAFVATSDLRDVGGNGGGNGDIERFDTEA